MQRKLLALVVLILAPTWAAAQTSVHSDGHIFDLTCNASGYVLQSRYPLVRIVGAGIEREVVEGRETVYLGKSCDAVHALYGNGTWCWANGGFVVEFEAFRYGFPRQELYCPINQPTNLECGC